jgi:hypothetical protein
VTEKDRKKQLRNQYKKKELLNARKRLGLYPDQLRELHGYLGKTVISLGIPCDQTLTRTREWAVGVGLDPEAVARGVGEFGAFCDCEVLRNVTPDKFDYPEEQAWRRGAVSLY